MRSIDVSLSAIHDDAVFVWAIDVFCAQYCLPSGSDASGGRKDVVITVAFVKLWSFDRWMVGSAVEHCFAVVEKFRAVGTHPINRENTLYPRAAVGPGMDQVRIAIIVPEWSGI